MLQYQTGRPETLYVAANLPVESVVPADVL